MGWVLLQLDSDDLLDNPGEAQSAFYEGPGVSAVAPNLHLSCWGRQWEGVLKARGEAWAHLLRAIDRGGRGWASEGGWTTLAVQEGAELGSPGGGQHGRG